MDIHNNLYIIRVNTINIQIFQEVITMEIMKDEGGQGAAEYILLFGGVIVIAIAALLIYRAYFGANAAATACQDISTVRQSV